LKPLFHFKNPEFKFFGYRFFFSAIFLLLFYNGTYGHDKDEILIYSSGENNIKTNLKADHENPVVNNQLAATYHTASIISVVNAPEKAEVYSRNFMTVYQACYFIFKKRVRNRVITSLTNSNEKNMINPCNNQ
jgi:hypothetical protein